MEPVPGEPMGMRDLPSGAELLALARALPSKERPPRERRREARLAAAARAIAGREAKAGDAPFRPVLRELARFYDTDCPSPSRAFRRGSLPLPAIPGSSPGRERIGVRGDPPDLLRRFADDLRRGAFERSPRREPAARALLWRLTLARLRLANPRFLAAHGFA